MCIRDSCKPTTSSSCPGQDEEVVGLQTYVSCVCVSNFHASVIAVIWKIGRPMKLETERLVIDHLTMPDLDAFAAMEADEQVRRYIDGKTRTRAQTADYIVSMLQSYEARGYGRYAVRSKADRSLIGICGFIDEEYLSLIHI